jgi:hypothetical protein
MKMRLECVVPKLTREEWREQVTQRHGAVAQRQYRAAEQFRPNERSNGQLVPCGPRTLLRKITGPSPTLIHLHQIPQTTVCKQTPFVQNRIEVRATCLRHEEARVPARSDSASRASRHHAHNGTLAGTHLVGKER